ncbi:MAG: carboxypeptidase-like regulatory domain-containing protein, partial [Ignavibacterium sp.]
MKYFYYFLATLYILLSVVSYTQTNTGKIAGRLIDSDSGEPIIGANIYIENSNIGAATDLDGKFEISNLKPGSYNIIISYISYQKTKFENTIVESGKVTFINVALKQSSIEITDEIIVLGERSNSYEAALINQKKNSTQIIDGISAETIKRLTDNTTAETLRRVPGITLLDNKYIYIRGVSERYSGALLNNAPLASSEPDKKEFAFDLIPSNLIENTVVIKSFTPDEPGDLAGGLVKINTVEFPDEAILSFNYSTGYVNNTSTKTFKTYSGGKLDFLGFDDGIRSLPSDFPDPLTFKNLDNQLADTMRYYYSSKLNDKWGLKNSKAILDQSFGLTFGDRFSLFGNDLGLVSSLSYKTGFNAKETEVKDIENEENQTLFFDYKGIKNSKNVFWGGIANLTYKLGSFNKISFKNIFTVSADDEVTLLRGFKYDYQDERIITAYRFTSRNLYSTLLEGVNQLPSINNTKLNWKFFYSSSLRDEPDFRRAVYTRSISDSNTTVPFIAYIPRDPDLYAGGRYYSKLKEFKRGFGVDLSTQLSKIKLKSGIFFSSSNRSFNARLLSVTSPTGSASQFIGNYDLDSVFSKENFQKRIIVMREFYDPSNDYTSSDNLFTYYIMTEFPVNIFEQNIIIITGIRIENNVQRLRTTSSIATGRNPINIDNFDNDLLHTVSVIYKLNEYSNLRLAYSYNIN